MHALQLSLYTLTSVNRVDPRSGRHKSSISVEVSDRLCEFPQPLNVGR